MAIDYDALFGAPNYNPCDALVALRPAYMKLVAGGAVERVSFRDRTTTWRAADLKEFKALIAQLEADCAAASGGPRKRMAITAGGRRA